MILNSQLSSLHHQVKPFSTYWYFPLNIFHWQRSEKVVPLKYKNFQYCHTEKLFKLIYCYFYILACYRFKTSFLRQIQLNHMSITANSVLESRDTAATIQRAWHQLQRTFKTTPLFYHFSPAFISADIVYQCKYTCSRHNFRSIHIHILTIYQY